MSREFLKISSTLAEYIQEYFDNPNSDISDIQRWFHENIRGGDQLIVNRSKVSAIWLYKQLSQYKSNILNQKLVKEALNEQLKLEAAQIVDYFTSQQDSEKIILLYYKYKQGYKSLKTGQEIHRQVNQLRKTINKSIKKHLKVNLDIDNIKEIKDAQFKQSISKKIHEQRLDIIKDYLEDIGDNNQVTPGITIDEIKNIIQSNGLTDSKLEEYIVQIYNQEVISKDASDTESEDTSYRTSDSSTNDRTEYNKLIKKIRYKEEEQLKKPINKVLLEIDNNASQKHGLRIIKLYGINNLNIDIEVNEQATIDKVSIRRNGSGNKQDNHTVPVSTFLKSLEKNLKNKELTENTVKNLLHQYGKYLQDSASNPQQQRNPQHTSEFDWIKDKISSFDSKTLDWKLSIIEKYIIPFIFYEWNTRAEATFRAVKEATAYGAEGNLIKKINKQFSELIKSLKKEEIQSIDDLKEKINEILPEYCKSIDLPHENQLTSTRLGVVVSDARRLFKVWFSLLENVDKNLGLLSLLDSNGSNDYKSFKEEFFDRQTFGEQIINSKRQLTRKQKQSLKNKLSEYIASNPETVDSGSDHSESDQSSSPGGASPTRYEDVDVTIESSKKEPIKIEYTSDKIKLILQHYLPQKNIEQVYLIDAPDQYHNCVDNLKQQLIWETKNKVIFNDKFYVVIERPDDQSRVSSVIMLKLFNKNNKNQIKMLPIVDSINGAGYALLLSEFRKDQELRALKIKVDSMPDWFLKHQSTTNVYLNNLIEVIKLSIECNAPCKVGDNDIEEIMSESSIEYEKTHKSILDQVSRVSIGEQAGTSGILKRKGIDGGDSIVKKVKFNLENIEEHRDNINLQASDSGCSTRTSSKKRLKRDLCQEKETEEIFPYEPLEENIAESSKVSARLYSQIAYLVALEHPEPTNPNIKPDNVLTYALNIGDIISEEEINHSLREQELLQTHYQEAQDFCNTYPKDKVLDLVGAEIDSSSRAWLFDNGKHSLLVSYDGNRYHIYSPDLNYRQSFQTKEGVRFADIELYAEAFFKWCSNSIEYDLFTLKQNILEEITTGIKQAKFWHPDEVVSDLVLLDKGSFSNIEGIPAKVIRELFFLDGKVPELMILHEDFFTKYFGRISIRIEGLHNVLSSLDLQASESLVNSVKQHNFRVDTAYINNMLESTKTLLHSYHNEVSNKLKTSESITIQDLSDLSWQVLAKEMTKNPEISSELRELSLQSVKELHSVAATRAHELGITSQTLFFLPDIIRSMNTGNFEGLQKTSEMMLGDMAFNKMYDSLISKLGSVLPESRIALLKKLPITSPIFKVLTIHSIIELHKQLNNLPADSEEAGIIKHQLGEQYFTIGLMVAELFGLELGPLWVGLMAEQLVYGTISLRKQYHLDISFGEAFLMNLGFEQDKLQSILTERQLVDLNLSLVDRLSAQTNTSYGLVIIKVPKMLYDAPQVGNTVIEFKPQNSRFCMEDNVFLEKNSGYKRISSVISDEQNNNCVDTAALQISSDGLAALYGNNNSTEQQSIYVSFDPNEGDMKLHFTKEGLSRLDKLNNNQQNNTNATRPYVVTAQICHKPYPNQIGLFGNTNHSFILNDDSKRVVSNYYIDGTSSFKLDDNTISTSIMFLNRKLFAGYNAFISGNTSNIQVRSMSPDEEIIGNIILKNKDYLKLNLNYVLIDGKLVIDIPNIEILHAQGAATLLPSHHHNTLEVRHNVLTFKILLEAPSIRQITINNKNASDVIIDTEHLANTPFTISLHGIHTQHKSYYTFEVANLQLVLDEMTFTSSHFPKYFIFLCGSSDVVKGWCKWDNNDLTKNILSIKGKINGKDEILTIEHSKATLGIFENENKCNKHIEIINYDNVIALENSLKFEKVLKYANYNISAYYSYINKHDLLGNWHTVEFFDTNSNCTILHHFKHDNNIQINEINYLIKENKIYALPQDNIDGNKLLRNYAEKPVPIFFNVSLGDSQISLEKNIIINNSTLYNLPDTTSLVFQKSNGEIFPISLRFLKDSFKYIKSDSGQEHLTSLMNLNQIRFITIERNISIISGNNLEQLQVISTTYDKKINESPYHTNNNVLAIRQYGNNSSIHKVMLSNELSTQHINIILNTGCNTFSTHCFTSQYEFNCLNTPIKIKDNTHSTSIKFNQYNYIKTLSSQELEVQCNDNIVSTINLKTQQDLVLYNLVIQGELKVAANNVTILHAKSINNGYIMVEETTKDFKMILGGYIHIDQLSTVFASKLDIIPTRIDNDNMQLVYEYTEKYPIPVYTVKLEHINQNLFDSIDVSTNSKEQYVYFSTPGGALCKWSCTYLNSELSSIWENVRNVFKIQGKLYDDKKGSLSLEGDKYILRVYNQARELDLEEIKYHNQPLQYHINKSLSFEGMIPICNASYYCYYNFSPNLSITTKNQVNYDSTHNILVFIRDNYKVFYHFNHQDIEHNINNVYYNITSNEICAMCNDNQSLSSITLLKYQNNDTVPICFNSMLQNANITKYRDGLLINNCFLDKITEKTMINFQDSKNHSFQELLSSSANPRLRRAIKEDKQYSEEVVSATIDKLNNGLWHWVWNKLSNLSFKLLPEADAATLDKSKSFNDIYKLIKQSNNHPSETQINKSNDITSQYNYEIPNSKYKNSVPLSDNDQKLHCVPYSWNSNNQAYVTDTMTCVSPSGQAKVFSNVHQETNFIQTKVYSIHGDIYTNCRPVEFYGRDSVYCEGKHTNMIYTPVFQSKFFDNLDVQIMLFRVGVHLVKKVLDCMKIKPKQEYIERHIEIDKETIDLWTKSIEKVEILLNDLQDLANLNQEDLKFINNTNDDLCEIRQNIKNYIEKKMTTTKEYEIINEKLEALIEELDETENRYFINVKEDFNQKISIEQLPHASNGVQHNTVYNRYYIGHNNSQEYYDNSYLLHDARPVLTGLEVMNQNFEGNNMISPSLIGNTTEIVI